MESMRQADNVQTKQYKITTCRRLSLHGRLECAFAQLSSLAFGLLCGTPLPKRLLGDRQLLQPRRSLCLPMADDTLSAALGPVSRPVPISGDTASSPIATM